MATHQVATSFPDTSYSTTNKPSTTTLKSDIQILEDGHNAHDADTEIHITDIDAMVTLTGAQTLTNKTLTSPVLNTGLSGTAFLDEDAMTSNSATKVASQQSIRAYVTSGTVTMTNKTLTTPVIASFYQDAGKTKLMTTPNTTSDTLAAIAATQTLTNKTLTTPVIASFYQNSAKTQLMTAPNVASDTLAVIAAAQTLTNKRIDPRTNTVASSATPTINTDTTDIFTITALAAAITSFTTNLSGTPVNGQKLTIRILDNGTARAITWGASFASRGATLPATTVLGKYLYVGFIYNSTASVWDCVAVSQEA